jgi:hypothetical protein
VVTSRGGPAIPRVLPSTFDFCIRWPRGLRQWHVRLPRAYLHFPHSPITLTNAELPRPPPAERAAPARAPNRNGRVVHVGPARVRADVAADRAIGAARRRDVVQLAVQEQGPRRPRRGAPGPRRRQPRVRGGHGQGRAQAQRPARPVGRAHVQVRRAARARAGCVLWPLGTVHAG